MVTHQKRSGHHNNFVYTVVIVSNSARVVHSKLHPMNIIFTILFVSTMGWTLSCMTLNSSINTHCSTCSCWKSSTYDNGVFKRIHHWKNPHSSLGQHWKGLYRFSFLLSEILMLALKPHKQFEFQNWRPSSISVCIASDICKKKPLISQQSY